MKVSAKWLRDYVDLKLTLEELAEKLTMAGLEVNSIETIGAAWDNIVVTQITAINPHPNADRLRLATIDTGKGSLTVVCGAPNVSVGQKVPFAAVGAQLIDGHTGETVELKPAKIRGVVSEGMICSEKELGLSDEHTGIMLLPGDAPVGTPLLDYMGDTVLELDMTNDMAYASNIVGVAREIAALTSAEFRPPDTSVAATGDPIEGQVTVEIADPDLCKRYSASLIRGVNIGQSPFWIIWL